MSNLDELFESLDFEGIEEENLAELSTPELTERLKAYDKELSDLDQLLELNPNAEARELHSRRGAIVVELRKRGM